MKKQKPEKHAELERSGDELFSIADFEETKSGGGSVAQNIKLFCIQRLHLYALNCTAQSATGRNAGSWNIFLKQTLQKWRTSSANGPQNLLCIHDTMLKLSFSAYFRKN